MRFTLSSQQLQNQISHKSEIIRLIKKTNDKIADFNEVPTVINAMTGEKSYIEQAQRGKEIALAIQVLLVNTRSILPLKFFQDLKIENRYKDAYKKHGEGIHKKYLFLAEDGTQQYEGIMKLIYFYEKLLDAIYSLPDFSDVIMVNTKKQKRREALTEEEEEEIFEV